MTDQSNVRLDRVVHDCATPGILPVPDGAKLVIARWRCPDCGQKWRIKSWATSSEARPYGRWRSGMRKDGTGVPADRSHDDHDRRPPPLDDIADLAHGADHQANGPDAEARTTPSGRKGFESPRSISKVSLDEFLGWLRFGSHAPKADPAGQVRPSGRTEESD